MLRLRSALALAAVLATGAAGITASPAVAADQLAACDATTAPALQWSAPSFVAWGRQARIGANVTDPGDGPGYNDGSAKLSVDAGSAGEANDPLNHDFESVPKAPALAASVNAAATWGMVDDTGAVLCGQTAALSVPLGIGKTLDLQGDGFEPRPPHAAFGWSRFSTLHSESVRTSPRPSGLQRRVGLRVQLRLDAPSTRQPVAGHRVRSEVALMFLRAARR